MRCVVVKDVEMRRRGGRETLLAAAAGVLDALVLFAVLLTSAFALIALAFAAPIALALAVLQSASDKRHRTGWTAAQSA
jgi:hypothetical protein